MKIMKSYRQLIPLIGIPWMILCGVLLYFSGITIQIFKIHWLVLLAVLMIAGTPLGKRRLASSPDEPRRYKTWAWLGLVIVFQLILGMLFWGITTVCGQTAPILTTPQTGLIHFSLKNLLIYEGLFPWGFFALAAVGFGYVSYHQKKEAYFAELMASLIQSEAIKVTINFFARFATMLVYSATLALIALLWASLVNPITTGFFLTPILVMVILLLLSFTKIYRRNLIKTLGKDIPLIPGLFFWVVFLAAIIWLLNGFLGPVTHIALAPPTLINHWLSLPWRQLWLIFINCWWLLWMPIAGITLARISRGYRFWQVILAILGLPVIVAIVVGLVSNLTWQINLMLIAILSGIGLIGLFLMTLHKKSVPAFILSYLPRQDHYKFRSYQSTVIKVTQIAAGFLFIYLPAGLTLVHYFFFCSALSLIIISLLMLLKQFYYAS